MSHLTGVHRRQTVLARTQKNWLALMCRLAGLQRRLADLQCRQAVFGKFSETYKIQDSRGKTHKQQSSNS